MVGAFLVGAYFWLARDGNGENRQLLTAREQTVADLDDRSAGGRAGNTGENGLDGCDPLAIAIGI